MISKFKQRFLFLLVATIIIASCKKETSIGADLLPPTDLLNARSSDTFTLLTKTIADPSVRSDKLAKNYLGKIIDPIFGTQTAKIVVELDRGDIIYDDTLKVGGATYTLDSVVLFLRYNGAYGDTLIGQDFTVSSINANINESVIYNSDNTTFTANQLLGSATDYKFKPSQKVSLTPADTFGTSNIIRINLDNNLAFFQNLINLPAAQLRDSLFFKNYFPGIIIENTSGSNGKAMAEVDLTNINSGISIFYKDKYNKNKIMKLNTSILRVVNSVLATKVNAINLFSNNLSSEVQNNIASPLLSDSIHYSLSQAGTLVKISLPTIKNIGKVAVNKAVLTITQLLQNDSPKNLTTPFSFSVLKTDANGKLDFLPKAIQYTEGTGTSDSVFTDNMGNKIIAYKINLTKYIQDILLNTETNSDIYLATYRSGGILGSENNLFSSTINFGYIPSRIIFGGAHHSNPLYRMKLNIIYTELK